MDLVDGSEGFLRVSCIMLGRRAHVRPAPFYLLGGVVHSERGHVTLLLCRLEVVDRYDVSHYVHRVAHVGDDLIHWLIRMGRFI